MKILKKIVKNHKDKLKGVNNILNKNKNYTILFDKNDRIILTTGNNKVLTAGYNFYGILQPNDVWIWATAIPGIGITMKNKIKSIRKNAHLFEKSNNPKILFYHHFLTQDIVMITDKKQIQWINQLLLYLDDSIYYLNPLNSKKNVQFITLSKIFEKYV